MDILETIDVKQKWDLEKIEMFWIDIFKSWGFIIRYFVFQEKEMV